MSKEQSITPSQLVCLTVGSALMYPYTILPILLAPPKNQDVWISLFFAILYILILSLPLIILIVNFRGIKVNEINDIIMGPVIGKVFSFVFIGFFIFCYCACMLLMMIFIQTFTLQSTPEWAILGLMAVPIVYASFKGAGVIGRISLFIVPLMILSILIFFLFAIPDMKINLIKPILADSTILDLNLGGFLTAARYSDITIYFVFSYFLIKKAKFVKTYFTGLTIFGISFFMILVPVLLILGPAVAKNEWNPYFVFTRQLEAYDFLRRMHSLNLLAWFPGALLKLMLYNYMIGHMLEGIFKTKSHKAYVFIVAVLGILVCLLPFFNKNHVVDYLRSDSFFPWIVLPAIFVVPTIMLITFLVRKKSLEKIIKQKKEENEQQDTEEDDDDEDEPNEPDKGQEKLKDGIIQLEEQKTAN